MMQNKVTLSNKLENYVWQYLYDARMHLIYDGRTSYEADGHIADLPTPEEINSLEPNPCGWGTGMEDSMIHGGMMLSILVNKYKLTKDEHYREKARNIYLGIKLCANISGVPGFLARSVSPIDGKSHYINSSRDQYTLAVVGLCDYFDSPLSTTEEKEEIKEILKDFAIRARQNVIAPDYNYRTKDDRVALVCTMWKKISFHEEFRLPMIYLAAYHVSGEKQFWDWYEEICDEALLKSEQILSFPLFFTYQQMFKSLEIGLRYDRREAYQAKMRALLAKVIPYFKEKAEALLRQELAAGAQYTTLFGAWREAPSRMVESEGWNYKKIVRGKAWGEMEIMRNIAIPIYMLSLEGGVDKVFAEHFCEWIDQIDLERHATGAPIYLLESLVTFMLNEQSARNS